MTRTSTRLSVVVLALVALTACAKEISATGSGTSGAAITADAARAETVLADIRDQIDGSPEQRDAAEANHWAVGQKLIQECMKKRGMEYSVPAWDGPRSGPNDGIMVGGVLATAPIHIPDLLTATFRERLARVATAPAPEYAALTGQKKLDYESVVTACSTYASQQNPDGAPLFPAGYDALEGPLGDLLGAAAARPDVQSGMDDYARCLDKSGFTVKEPVDLVLPVDQALAKVPAGVKDPGSDAAFLAAVDLEARLNSADTACRSTVRQLALATALPALEAFRLDHAKELAALEASWVATAAGLA